MFPVLNFHLVERFSFESSPFQKTTAALQLLSTAINAL